jgi:hypothetical protein
MAKQKLYTYKEAVYKANSKKELAEFLNVTVSKIHLIKEADSEDTVYDLDDLQKEVREIERAKQKLPFTNKTTRYFKINENLGGKLEGWFVSEIYENGYFYKIEDGEDWRIVFWYDLYKDKPLKKDIFRKDALQINFYQTSLGSLIHSYYNFGIDMDPSYQRDLVWTQDQKELLIDSIINKRDIGKFVLIEISFEEDTPGYEILDGKQRLSTIIEFFEDRFSYNGIYFSELSLADKRSFDSVSISMAKVDERFIDEDQIIEYFINLNISGTPVSKEFLENLKNNR